ncbi:DEP domain-containing mTOR-interacting protein-like, partial [Lingula anatina]|uniref:DEP domain-containing mTOR-interacting protein-like n=1 Tax=Lingula anatina TaxID=7574 RepID=A0A1S3JA49_LINAN
EDLNKENPNIIQTRRYHLRNYSKCFVGKELVQWLIDTHRVQDRETAVLLMRILQDHYVLHHVCDDHQFKDEKLFYRFRVDDDSFPQNTEAALYLRAYSLYKRLLVTWPEITQEHVVTDTGQVYTDAFYGSTLVDWLIHQNEASTREEAFLFCRDMVESGILRHITDDYHFRDGHTLYKFRDDFGQRGVLTDLLKNKRSASRESFSSIGSSRSNTSLTQYFYCPERNHKTSEASSSSNDSVSLDADATEQPKSVLLTGVTVEELEAPNTPYVKRCIRVCSDSVGYGFVIRGESPTYVQTVDPASPAAAAGIKVRQFLYSINGINVLRKNHREVAKIILGADGFLDIEVMMHFRESSL